MASRNRVNIASRSASAPAALAAPFCSRCSKRLFDRKSGNIPLACGRASDDVKCGYCASPTIKKPCLEVSFRIVSVTYLLLTVASDSR
jgi:hypothetical protein